MTTTRATETIYSSTPFGVGYSAHPEDTETDGELTIYHVRLTDTDDNAGFACAVKDYAFGYYAKPGESPSYAPIASNSSYSQSNTLSQILDEIVTEYVASLPEPEADAPKYPVGSTQHFLDGRGYRLTGKVIATSNEGVFERHYRIDTKYDGNHVVSEPLVGPQWAE